MRRALFLAVAAIGIPVAFAWIAVRPVSAHGFGERYDLPLPLSLFVLAGGAAVALSFVIAAVFLQRGRAAPGSYPRLNLLDIPVVSLLAETWVTVPLRTASLILTVYVIGGALIGSERAALNPAPAAGYVAFWVGLSFFSALLGNLWALVNPWKVLWTWFEYLADLIRPGAVLGQYVPYPSRLGVWPAVLVFAGFAFLETVVADSAGPRVLGWILVGYTVYNLVGMFLFGKDVWLRNAEGFTLVFGFMARFSVTEVRAPVSVCEEDCTGPGLGGWSRTRRRAPDHRPGLHHLRDLRSGDTPASGAITRCWPLLMARLRETPGAPPTVGRVTAGPGDNSRCGPTAASTHAIVAVCREMDVLHHRPPAPKPAFEAIPEEDWTPITGWTAPPTWRSLR